MEKMAKSWKQKLAAATAAAALTQLPIIDTERMTEDEAREQTKQPEKAPTANFEDYTKPMGSHPVDNFLSAISTLESSGGKNTAHKKLDSGLHEGHSAIGSFGIMPNTFRNIVSSLGNKESKLRAKLGPEYKDDEFEFVSRLPDRALEQTLKSRPDLQLRAARYLAEQLHDIHSGDPDKMAYGWRFGTNRASDKITPKMLEGSGYVQGFRKYFKKPEQIIPHTVEVDGDAN